MPRHTHLLRRGSRYYFNVKVPLDLRKHLRKTIIRKSLATSDPREANRLVRFESLKWQTYFDDTRRTLRKTNKAADSSKRQLPLISDNEAHALVLRWFRELEKIADDWWNREGLALFGTQLVETIDTLRIDEAVLSGGNDQFIPDDGTHDLDAFLAQHDIDCPKNSAAYQRLQPLFRRARLENTQRILDRLTNQRVETRDPLFRETFAHTRAESPPGSAVTVGELLRRFAKQQKDANRSAGTQTTYKIPARILREVLGEETLLSDITPEDIEGVCDLLRQFPKNAAQRYPKLTLQQAIAEAAKRGNSEKLGEKTLANYFNNIVSVFNFAVGKHLIAQNPANDRWLRERFSGQPDKPKAQFTIGELKQLFRAPLYAGCKNDESGFAIPGANKPRRGRFWVPLLSLFHGLRCNEAAQLYTEDVKFTDGIHYLAIREEREDGSKCDKRLKTKQSKRDVPIHPELVRIGFLDFVATRRKDSISFRLFPELTAGSTGYFSNAFSKWFARFAETALGHPTNATFHSFRHQFRDATRAARLSVESVARLAGWERGAADQQRQVFEYGRGAELLRMLAEDIAKVGYPGLDLSHLYPR